jgi:hypothetical protein
VPSLLAPFSIIFKIFFSSMTRWVSRSRVIALSVAIVAWIDSVFF